MELVRPSFEIWEQEYNSPIEDMYKHIARCTRVCYQSEKKDNNETEEEFVKRVILRKEPWSSEANHLAMLEHGTIYLKAEDIVYDNPLDKYDYNKYSEINYRCNYSYVTTNLRVLIENNWIDDLKYICAPTEYHTRRVTVSFTTNIGVTREFNRHRVNSIAEESTRYCNYNKRNDGEIQFVVPAWWDGPIGKFNKFVNLNDKTVKINNKIYKCSEREIIYLVSLMYSEHTYNALIEKSWKPQQAREVLPLATKTQLIHTAFIEDWKHFFKLRAEGISGTPHPNASYLAKPLFEEFKRRNYV